MRIAFFSAFCLQDPASGAAHSVRTILEGLAARGHETLSVTGASFDAPNHGTEAEMLTAQGFRKTDPGHWILERNGLTQVAFETGSLKVETLSRHGLQRLLAPAASIITGFGADAVLSYGGTIAEITFRAEMHKRGVAQVFYLANPSYKSVEVFENTDLIFCDSQATASLYQGRLGIKAVPIGKFVNPLTRDPGQTPSFVTFINPSFRKGVSLFYRIAQMMHAQAPNVVFQVIESRASLKAAEMMSRMPFSRMTNIRAIGLQQDISRILSRTKVLMVPSLWHESGPRVGLEAMSLGIPVVGSKHSGLLENVGDGGILIGVPDKLRKDNRLIPPPRVALPWVAAIAELMQDQETYDTAAVRARRFWDEYVAQDRIGFVETQLLGLCRVS